MSLPVEIPRRSEIIRGYKERGGGIAAVYPIHYPRELFRAFDLLPVEVWGPPGRDPIAADAHLQSYVCSIVRCGLAFALSGGFDVADLIVVPHGCDSLQGLGSVLLDLAPPGKPVLPIYIPRGCRESDTVFLAAEIRAAYERLAEIRGVRPAEEDLVACIEREARADAALAGLLSRRPTLALSNRHFYAAVRAREVLPAEQFEELARSVMDGVAPGRAAGVPVLLSGLVPEPADLLDALDEAGLAAVADDMACAGRRCYPEGSSSDPFRRMAERLLGGPPDPTRGCAIGPRAFHLVDLARRSGARGAVFCEVKFCEPELFHLPLVRQGLEGAGVRSITLEMDIADTLPHQVRTQLEAFAEALA